jgi:hypothetical protein
VSLRGCFVIFEHSFVSFSVFPYIIASSDVYELSASDAPPFGVPGMEIEGTIPLE